MYNIKIAQECNEEEYVEIIATINKLLEKKHSNDKLIVRKLKRTKENVPERNNSKGAKIKCHVLDCAASVER